VLKLEINKEHIMTIIRHQPGAFYSAAVEYNGMVFVAGQIADDRSQPVQGQTEQVLKKIDAALALAGTNKSKLLSANVWLADIGDRDTMNTVWTAWVDPKNLPARATVEAKLGTPATRVEIAVICAK
jgi:enamine deaminase RidA (YjgF/YER057c/UK114 family)